MTSGAALEAPPITVVSGAGASGTRVTARGKFFFCGSEKFFLKAVTYGPFAPGPDGAPFPRPHLVRRDFELIEQMGANGIRVFGSPPRWLLDFAVEYNLRVVVGAAWAEHVCFLEQPGTMREIRRTVADGVNDVRGHPAVLAHLIGNEIPPEVVRWHGHRRVRAFLRDLCDLVRQIDDGPLISYANFPLTEYLELDFLDFVAFNVYLHREPDFRRYLKRLQNLTPERPLVLTELGIDSIREGRDAQATILEWQVRAAFELGVAGATIFSWTDDWYTGGFQVEDWAFGLVDRERGPKPAYEAVRRCYADSLPAPPRCAPLVSVVVCAYNAEETIGACLESLRLLRYPDYEVVLVNDGSADRTLEIAQRFPEVRIVSQTNRGLSAARNAGIEASSGEIVAFTDADCAVDPDWLVYLAHAFVSNGFVAVGGPNLPPASESRTVACVAAAPGGPTHVLLNDEVAEHIPGCNMAFRKEVLRQIGGFDAVFRVAGDDVDVCWRLQNQGYSIGFSPAALVWHERRRSVRAYLRQQRGYGAAEALLHFKHPYRFNLLGQSKWLGRIYGGAATPLLLRRPVIYYGAFGRAMFQTLYETPSSIFAYLPFTLEWHLAAVALIGAAVATDTGVVLSVLPLLVGVGAAAVMGWQARVEPRHDRWGSRMLLACLIYLGPFVRSFERCRSRMRYVKRVGPLRTGLPSRPRGVRTWTRTFALAYWSDRGQEKEDLLRLAIQLLELRRYHVAIDEGWTEWDLEVQDGLWARAKLLAAVENHGGTSRLLRMRCRLLLSRRARALAGACAALAAAGALTGHSNLVALAGAAAVVGVVSALRESVALGRVIHHVVESAAERLSLTALGPRGSSRDPRRE